MNGIELNAALGKITEVGRIQGIVKSMRFIDYVKVTKVDGNFVDGERGDIKLTNMEVLSLGANGYAIHIVPKKDDIVLAFSSRTYIKDMKDFEQDGGVDSYSNTTLKCIPLCSVDNAESTITIDESGFEFKDKDNNTIAIDSSGITFTDSSNNEIAMTSTGITVTDKNKNSMEMSSNGINITDSNNNIVDMTSTGITITDSNNKTVEMTSSGTVINGKLKVK